MELTETGALFEMGMMHYCIFFFWIIGITILVYSGCSIFDYNEKSTQIGVSVLLVLFTLTCYYGLQSMKKNISTQVCAELKGKTKEINCIKYDWEKLIEDEKRR